LGDESKDLPIGVVDGGEHICPRLTQTLLRVDHGHSVDELIAATHFTNRLQQICDRAVLTPTAVPTQDDSALLFIPKIGVWGVPIVAGVDEQALASGVGRYPSPGNFALAGHRTANGEPFADIDELEVGDVVIVRTRHATFRYRLIDDVVVEPDKTWVIGDVTERLDLDADSPVISLVTCSPKWSTEKRWVWWGALIDEA